MHLQFQSQYVNTFQVCLRGMTGEQTELIHVMVTYRKQYECGL
jgi:hypothetical protein